MQRGLALVDEALAARPRWAYARAARASLLMVLAETPSGLPRQQALRSEAQQELDRALVSNPNLAAGWERSLAPR